MSDTNETAEPTFEFDKFMKDLDKREKTEADHQRDLRESDETNPTRELNRRTREEWRNRVTWRRR
jgi:hypothetical protein